MGTPITTSQDGPSFASNLVDNQGSCYSNVSPLSSTFTKDCDENRIRSDNHYGQKEREESSSSEISSLCQSNAEGSDMEHLQSANPIHNLQSFEPSGHRHEQPFPCKTRRMPGVGRRDCLSIWILVSSFYSTGSSLLWMMLAVTKCQYETLGLPGHMSSHTATVFCTAISKTIELTFATVFVTFLGQVLSVRALGTDQSISIAEMSMRGWITQPGTLFTHLGSSLQVAFTRLGGFAFLAAVTAMLYTTASDSLVAPKLNSGKNQDLLLRGRVTTSFANTTHVMAQCTTPISNATDNQTFQTCIQLQHAGQAYHNYIQYLGSWQEEIQNGRVSKDQSQRPRAVGMLNDNTSVTGDWTNVQPMPSLFEKYNRTVNNVTMAMPHSGVISALRDPINRVVQPQNSNGFGEYHVRASVLSPVVNVLCTEMEIEELTPIIYTLWPQPYFNGTLPNATNWPEEFNLTLPDSQRQTAVDDLFGFDDFQVHPIFPKIPLQYNIVLNDSIGSTPEAIYLLATSPTDRYTLCSIRASVSPNCSTNYRATTSGGTLNTNCQDNDERLTFAASNFTMPSRFPWSADWVNVASEWAMALALNDGIMDGKSSNAHLLTELIPTSPALDPQLPSISEALAVLAGNTLLLSALDSPFIHDPFNLPSPNTTQFFKAKISRQIYQSGGSQGWQRIFYIVLASVCLANLFCLMYFLHHGGLVTDFLEPQNSFCLSLLSPPSRALEGACGGGPTGEHYNKKWNIKLNEELGHLWFESSDDIEGSPKQRGSPSRKVEKEITPEDVARMYYKIRMKRTSWL